MTDDGPGMPEEVRRHCLEPFFSTKPRQFSTGLGLSLVHGIVAAAGGSLQVESSPGAGTTFILKFPVFQASKAGVALEPRTAVVSIDDVRIRGFVKSFLVAEGLRVQESNDAASADLWMVEVKAAPAKAVLDFLNQNEERRAILIGEDASEHPRLARVSAQAKISVLRALIHTTAALLSRGNSR